MFIRHAHIFLDNIIDLKSLNKGIDYNMTLLPALLKLRVLMTIVVVSRQ